MRGNRVSNGGKWRGSNFNSHPKREARSLAIFYHATRRCGRVWNALDGFERRFRINVGCVFTAIRNDACSDAHARSPRIRGAGSLF